MRIISFFVFGLTKANTLASRDDSAQIGLFSHQIWSNCSEKEQIKGSVTVDEKPKSYIICPLQLPQPNLTWPSTPAHVSPLIQRADALRTGAVFAVSFCRAHRILNFHACHQLATKIADSIGPMNLSASLRTSPVPVYRFLEPDPTIPHSSNARSYVVLKRDKSFLTAVEEPVNVSILLDAQSLPALTTRSPETETMYFYPKSISAGTHFMAVVVNGVVTDGMIFSVMDPIIEITALHIDDRYKDSLLIDVIVGHPLLGKENYYSYALRWPEWEICVLFDGLKLDTIPGTIYSEKFLLNGTRSYSNLTISLGGLSNGQHIITAMIVDQNRRVIAIASDLEAELTFIDPHNRIRDINSVDQGPFVRHVLETGNKTLHGERLFLGESSTFVSSSVSPIKFRVPTNHPIWSLNLSRHEWGLRSQNGEDGVLQAIFHYTNILSKYSNKFRPFFVEFGVGDGSECNTAFLRERRGFLGVTFDARYGDASIALHRTMVEPDNINELFSMYGVPRNFAVLSIDIDFHDYHVWKAIDDSRFRPIIVIVEYNSHIPPLESKTVPYDKSIKWDGYSAYFGASLLALSRLAMRRQYTLVHCESHGVNAFFVSNEALFDEETRHKMNSTDDDAALKMLVSAYFKRPNFYNRNWDYPLPTTKEVLWEDVP